MKKRSVLLLPLLFCLGCSKPSIVGIWEGTSSIDMVEYTDDGFYYILTSCSAYGDGTYELDGDILTRYPGEARQQQFLVKINATTLELCYILEDNADERSACDRGERPTSLYHRQED